MGVFGKLFGKGGERVGGEARCNECGMTAGAHTDWCPLLEAEQKAPQRAAEKGSPSRGHPDDLSS
jgi:hypothetical protein